MQRYVEKDEQRKLYGDRTTERYRKTDKKETDRDVEICRER